jgi:anti-sigma factor RsiW
MPDEDMPDEDEGATRRSVSVPADEAMNESDALLSALLDGELDAATESSLRDRLAREPALAERMASFERLTESLRELPAPSVASDLSDRMRARVVESERDAVLITPAIDSSSRSRGRGATPQRRRFAGAALGLAVAAAAIALYLLTPAAPPELPMVRETTPDRAVEQSLLARAEQDEKAIALYYDELAELEMLEQLELLEVLAAVEQDEQG